jgi:hypothetical protein
MGETQTIDTKRADEVQAQISAARDYLANVVAKDPKLRPLLGNCKLQHKDCAFWSVLGECENNPAYMKVRTCSIFLQLGQVV